MAVNELVEIMNRAALNALAPGFSDVVTKLERHKIAIYKALEELRRIRETQSKREIVLRASLAVVILEQLIKEDAS